MTNSRLEELWAAAAVAWGHRVAEGVRAMSGPGSGLVKAAAENEAIDRIFSDAGSEWREPGCSMCVGMNPDVLDAGEHRTSISNRKCEGRQGTGGLSYLMSPATAVAAAVAGCIVDVREIIPKPRSRG